MQTEESCCSWCSKPKSAVALLIAGPGPADGKVDAYICDDCVRMCMDIVNGAAAATKRKRSRRSVKRRR